MAVETSKYMEELYTLITLITAEAADTDPAIVRIGIASAMESNWLKKLGFIAGTAETRWFSHASEPDFSGQNVFDMLSIISTIVDLPQEGLAGLTVLFRRIIYDPVQAAGERILVEFAVLNGSGEDQRALACIGLSHSINR